MDKLNPSLGKMSGFETRVNPSNSAYPDLTEEPVQSWDAGAEAYIVNPDRRPSNYLTNNITNASKDFIRDNAGGPKPFLAYVPYNVPHSPKEASYHISFDGKLDRLGNDTQRYAGLSRQEFMNSGIEDQWFSPSYAGDWFPDPLFIYETYKDEPNGLEDFYGGSSTSWGIHFSFGSIYF